MIRAATHTTVRMVLCRDGLQYRRVSESELRKRLPNLVLECADGDEQANAVTYWYKPSSFLEASR